MKRRTLILSGAALLAPWLSACSRKEEAAVAPSPPPADPQAAYQLASTGSGFTVGQMLAADPVYVFFDPQCPHCAVLWEASKPLLERIKMVWIPVGLLSSASLTHGATILGDSQPVAAMDRHAVLVREKRTQHGDSAPVDEAARAKVESNTELFKRLGADSVPMVYFKNVSTGQFGRHAGGMSTEELRQLLGL